MIKVSDMPTAWEIAKAIGKGDYSLDREATARAGYGVYRDKDEHYNYICDLGDRLEVNTPDGKSVNVWIEKLPEVAKKPHPGTPEARPLEAQLFRDYGETRGALVDTLKRIADWMARGELLIGGYSCEDVLSVALVLDSLINRVCGIYDERTESEE